MGEGMAIKSQQRPTVDEGDRATPSGDERPGSAIAKAFSLLEALTRARNALALHELAEATGMPKASAHRMLLQLEEIGVVKRDLTARRFAVGNTLAELAVNTVGLMTRTGEVRDIMEALVAQIGESCNLGILDGRDVLYLERVECVHSLRTHLRAGSRVPLHATAVGKLILAFAPDDKRDRLIDACPLPKLTPKTLDREALLAQLPAIREEKLSINREESVLGVIGVGAPIFAPTGDLVAGLAIHAPMARFDGESLAATTPILRAAADRISQTMNVAPEI